MTRIVMGVVPPEGALAWGIAEALKKNAEHMGCDVIQLHIRQDDGELHEGGKESSGGKEGSPSHEQVKEPRRDPKS